MDGAHLDVFHVDDFDGNDGVGVVVPALEDLGTVTLANAVVQIVGIVVDLLALIYWLILHTLNLILKELLNKIK